MGLLPLMIILITASLSSKKKKSTAGLHIEKKLRLWSRDPDLTNVVFWMLCLRFPAAPFGLFLGVEIF